MKLREFARTLGWQLSLGYAAIFTGSALLLFVMIYYLLGEAITAKDRDLVMDRLHDYESIYGTGGVLAVNGNGVLQLTGTNTYTGATTINGGMLTLQVNGQAPPLAAAGAPAPLVWFDPSNPAGYTLTGGSVTTLMNLSSANSAAVGNAVTESGHGAPSQGDCSISHDPTRTFSRYASSHAAASRLFLMPTLAVDSFFNKPSAARRRMLRLTSA